MNVLFITAHKYLPQMYGGMQFSINQLCLELQKRDYNVSVLAGLMPQGFFGMRARVDLKIKALLGDGKFVTYNSLGYPASYAWFPWEAVQQLVKKQQPDIIVVGTFEAVRMARVAKDTNVPVLMLLQDAEMQDLGGAFPELGKIPCVANSKFTAHKFNAMFGVSASVVYPFILESQYKTETSRQNVTLINPNPIKGLHIALGIAEACPDIPFSLVETWPLKPDELISLTQRIEHLKNVTLVRRQKDMRKIYSKCKILLVPSIWEEAYGRVVTEAQFSGIPVVASNRGGLPEAVGTGGLLLNPGQPISDWIDAIRSLWEDADKYGRLSSAAVAYSARAEIKLEHQVNSFEAAMVSALSHKAAAFRPPPHG